MSIQILPVTGIGEISEGEDLAGVVCDHVGLRDGDVVVVAQKIVSKAEGRLVPVDPADRERARRELIERETIEVVARRGDLVISRTEHGFVCAAAGVDASNVPSDRIALLPEDPDASAARIRAGIEQRAGVKVAVVVADTFGRPWRTGQTNVALGVSGMIAVRDHRGTPDTFGHVLEVTEIALADEVAGAAELVMGKVDRVPVAVVRGLEGHLGDGRGADLIRPLAEDLFRRGG